MNPFRNYPWWRRWLGQRGERVAANMLRRKGFEILGRNIGNNQGELDLLALDGVTLVVIEVRSGIGRPMADLAASIDQGKQNRVARALQEFILSRRIKPLPVRFDVVLVCMG